MKTLIDGQMKLRKSLSRTKNQRNEKQKEKKVITPFQKAQHLSNEGKKSSMKQSKNISQNGRT